MDMPMPAREAEILPPAEGVAFEQWIGVKNVFQLLERSARKWPAKTAITHLGSNVEAPARKLSYQDLLDGVARSANALRSLDVQRGDVVAYMLPSLPETQFILWGAATAGAALPLNPLLPAEGLAALCHATGVSVLVALGPLPGTDIWHKAVRVRDLVPRIRALVQVGGERSEEGGAVHLMTELLLSHPAKLTFPDAAGLDDVAAYFHTGGTTGAPKLVIHTHRNQLAAAHGAAAASAVGPDDVIVNGLPMFHVASTMYCSLAMFAAGAELVVLSPSGFRNPDVIAKFWQIVDRFGVTIVGGVPTALAAVARVDAGGARLARVRMNVSGASLLPRSVAQSIEHITGRAMREVYGMTETAGVICIDPAQGDRVLGSAGLPVPFCRVEARRLVDGGASQVRCAPGETGVLVVQGPNVTPGYKDAGQSAELFTREGWLQTGDMGHVDPTGRVFITGRAKDLIIRGGHNIDPALIEECLLAHPAVSDAAAVGVPDAYAGELPVAYVVLKPDGAALAEELIHFMKSRLEAPAVPKRVFFVPKLPTTAVGKVYKPALRQECAEQHFAELLKAEPVTALAVRDTPAGRSLHVCLREESAESAGAARQRITKALEGYLVGIEWMAAEDIREGQHALSV